MKHWSAALALLLLAVGGCRRYYKVPRTGEAHECFNRCAELLVDCSRQGSGRGCQHTYDRCVSLCPGVTEVDYETWLEWTSADAGTP